MHTKPTASPSRVSDQTVLVTGTSWEQEKTSWGMWTHLASFIQASLAGLTPLRQNSVFWEVPNVSAADTKLWEGAPT